MASEWFQDNLNLIIHVSRCIFNAFKWFTKWHKTLSIISGFGSGAGAALLAEICRTTTNKERTAILSVCNGLRQIGLLIGPGFQILLELFDFSLFNGALIVTPYNAPGLFMALLWIIFLIFVLALYNNIYVEYKYELLRQERLDHDFSGRSLALSQSYHNYGALAENRLPISERTVKNGTSSIFLSLSVVDPAVEKDILSTGRAPRTGPCAIFQI